MYSKSYFDEPDLNGGMDAETELKESTTSRSGAYRLKSLMIALPVVAFMVPAITCMSELWCWLLAVVGFVVAFLLFSCIYVVLEWERVVVLRAGRFHRVAGPGLVIVIPFVDSVAATVDMRTRYTAFKAERVLTADLVPVNVDAVLFWTIWDAEKACVEVENYERIVYWVAQTTLRDAMGAVSVAQLSTRREQIDKEVADILESKTNEWGITVIAVDIRDIEIPADLQEALSAEARAERERNARMMLAETERDISDLFVEAAGIYGDERAALQLRAMSMVSDGLKEKGGAVVIPTSLAEAFGKIGICD